MSTLPYFAPPAIQFDTPKKPIPQRVQLLDITTESGLKFKRFSDGTDRQFKSVSAIKDKLSFFDKMRVSEGMAEKIINKKGIYAPDALAFGYDPATADWYVIEGRANYYVAYNEYVSALKVEQDAILSDWEHRGEIGKERGNFIDIVFENLINRTTFNADIHCAEYSMYQEKPFNTSYLIKVCDEFARLKKYSMDLLAGKNGIYITQYLAHANTHESIGDFGFATLGDLMILNPDKQEYFFFDVKADKSDKMYPNNYKKSFTKPLLGQMAYFEETLQNKYFFQVMCSLLAVQRTGGVWDKEKWINLQGWNYGGGGIIHWDSDKMVFNPIHMPAPPREKKESLSPFELLKQQSGLFIRDYFIDLKSKTKTPKISALELIARQIDEEDKLLKDAKSRISSVR